ncbi:MAG TPA: site-2 protease family protein [Ktedonobacterales bacterium]|nr:site-2 protease family protein [Ktedonobacterales bacterium]
MFERDPYRAEILYKGDARRSPNPVRAIAAHVNWEIVAGFLILIGFFVFVLWRGDTQWQGIGTFGFVVVGWVFSLCLHEFAHAATAYLGGDHSDSTRSYLTFNPLKYVHPVLSILLPLVFILLGGIGLPGGAVYLQRGLVRNRVWQSAISLAGPLMNALVALVCAVPFFLGFFYTHLVLASALAVLAFFQVAAVVLNLLPIPPLDGFGIISPWLSREVRNGALAFGNYTFIVLFLLLWYVPAANTLYFSTILNLLDHLRIDQFIVQGGFTHFRFWIKS